MSTKKVKTSKINGLRRAFLVVWYLLSEMKILGYCLTPAMQLIFPRQFENLEREFLQRIPHIYLRCRKVYVDYAVRFEIEHAMIEVEFLTNAITEKAPNLDLSVLRCRVFQRIDHLLQAGNQVQDEQFFFPKSYYGDFEVPSNE